MKTKRTANCEERQPTLSRRSAIAAGAGLAAGALAMSACGGDSGGGSPGVPQGTFENPYTQEASGIYAEGKETRNPQIFASLISNPEWTTKVTRIWIEVMDSPVEEATGLANATFDVLSSETLCTDGVTEIRLVDQDTKDVLAVKILNATWQPRFITEVSFPADVKKVAAYAYIESKGGWWRGPEVEVSTLASYLPTSVDEQGAVGSLRRPLTRFNPGFLSKENTNDTADLSAWKDLKHHGHWQSFGRKGVRLVLADMNDASDTTQVQAHGDWDASHYFKGGYFLDQNDQLIPDTAFFWGDQSDTFTTSEGRIAERREPVTTTALALGSTTKDAPYITFPKLPEGVTRIRFVWLCSLDGWWESCYSNIG